jgi:hypothetical protein
MLRRVQLLLAALWGGLLLSIAGLVMPSAFAVLERSQAVLLAGRIFSLEAQISLGVALVLMMAERRMARDGAGPAASAEFLLPAGALFSTVAGYYVLQPMMQAALAGAPGPSAMALHGMSMGFFALKTGLVLALAWRLSRRPSS